MTSKKKPSHAMFREKMIHQFMKRGNIRRKDLLEDYRRRQQQYMSSDVSRTSQEGEIEAAEEMSSEVGEGDCLSSPQPPSSSPDIIHQYIQENFFHFNREPSTSASTTPTSPMRSISFANLTPSSRPTSLMLSPPTITTTTATRPSSSSTQQQLQQATNPIGNIAKDWQHFVASEEYEDLYLQIEEAIRREA